MTDSSQSASAKVVSLYPETLAIVEEVNDRHYQGRNFSGALRYIVHDWNEAQSNGRGEAPAPVEVVK